MMLVYRGQRIEIDDEDWVRVKEHNWYPTQDGMRTKIKGEATLLARFIVSPKKDEVVTFGPKGRNCYCKSNLNVIKRTDFAFQQQKGDSPGINRGITPLPGGRFKARACGKYLGIFRRIEDARDAVQQAYDAKSFLGHSGQVPTTTQNPATSADTDFSAIRTEPHQHDSCPPPSDPGPGT